MSATCNKIQQCTPFVLNSGFGDLATCIKRNEMSCASGMTAPGALMTSAQLGACASAISQLSCADFRSGARLPACNLPGSRADGQPCGNNRQCKSDYCSPVNGACGTCASRFAAGASCKSGECQGDLVCNSKSVCAAPAKAGAPCTSQSDCVFDLVCASGTCAIPFGAGKACTAGVCDIAAGLICSSTHVCATIQLAKAGEPCGLLNGAYAICAAGGHCSITPGQIKGTCQAPAADGAACDSQNGPTCLSPAQCTNGKCTFPDPSSCG